MVIQSLSALIILAILVEITTNIIKGAIPQVKGPGSQIIALFIGITLAYATGLGILGQMNIPVRFGWVDNLLTGIIISRGSNAFHDLSQLVRDRKNQA